MSWKVIRKIPCRRQKSAKQKKNYKTNTKNKYKKEKQKRTIKKGHGRTSRDSLRKKAAGRDSGPRARGFWLAPS
jgi:hypothetical protein